jgi:elongator complex protein 3
MKQPLPVQPLNFSNQNIIETLIDNPSQDIKTLIRESNLSQSKVITLYKKLCKDRNITEDYSLIQKIQMKPIRTISGVVPITVLTKPFPCPGKCIFCPDDVMMPKSYLSKEPGAQRALMNKFDPYLQVKNRMQALQNIGHKTEKIELLVLGGTWSVYPRTYQEWFIKRCLDAMNEFKYKYSKLKYTKNVVNFNTFQNEVDPPSNWNINMLKEAQKLNQNGKYRCIGITLETRPDRISNLEAKHLRELGATKIQLGIQSTNDTILEINKRGETSKDQRNAIDILRSFGFKIQIHWMPNLYGSTPDIDKLDIETIYKDKSYMPDEIKIYPCSIIETAELYDYWKAKKYSPYSEEELIDILIHAKSQVKKYSRINRVIRDIPSTYIMDGNKKTNLRQLVQIKMKERGLKCECIRCREIKDNSIGDITYDIYEYETTKTFEKFLSYNTNNKSPNTGPLESKLLGFLRLSIPKDKNHYLDELKNSALIREVHVYGQALGIHDISNQDSEKSAQHLGIGTKLLLKAEDIAKNNGFSRLSVISGIGTREYYKKRGFTIQDLYQTKILF